MGSSLVVRLERYLAHENIRTPQRTRFVGKPGLTFGGLKELLDAALSLEGTGRVILHVGANDIGRLDDYSWFKELEAAFFYLKVRYPGYSAFWSDMLPRANWRYRSHYLCEKKRRRLWRRARGLFYTEGEGVIRHPELCSANYWDLISNDGVHLSDIGNQAFWNDFQILYS